MDRGNLQGLGAPRGAPFPSRASDGFLSSSHPARPGIDQCLQDMKTYFERTGSHANVLIITGRVGTGKTRLFHDLVDDQNREIGSIPTTYRFELGQAIIKDELNTPYYIMDTPGFDPGYEEGVYREIIRGIESIRPFAHVTGILYLKAIQHQRFDIMDVKLVHFLRRLCGYDYIRRVTLVTTFWTVASAEQLKIYNKNLEIIRGRWQKIVAVHWMRLYQHGWKYDAAGPDDDSVFNWFLNRREIAGQAKKMIARNYADLAPVSPRIIRELEANTPIHETDAGRFLHLPCPSSVAPDSFGVLTPFMVPCLPSTPSPSSRPVPYTRSNPQDPLSLVDIMEALGLDSSMEGRLRYTLEHDIAGIPFTAGWYDAMRHDLRRRYG